MCGDHPTADRAYALTRRSALITCAGIATFAFAKPSVAATPVLPVVINDGLTVNSRAVWAQGLAAKAALPVEAPQFLLVHHSVNANTYTAAAVAGGASRRGRRARRGGR